MVASRVEIFCWASTAVSQRVSTDTWLNWFRRLSRPLLSIGPMMDRATLEAYDANAASFAEDWGDSETSTGRVRNRAAILQTRPDGGYWLRKRSRYRVAER